MTVSKDKHEKPQATEVKDGFPRIVVIIMLAEFCERFSYSGMKSFLTLYLRSKLGYSDEGATEIYHTFSTFVYFFPIIGGILADNYFGNFKTILYMMFIYAGGNLLVAVTAVPHLELPQRLCTIFGLFLITLGTGGIKPCVTAFGGDQFILPQQEKQLTLYFNILYFNICIGNLIAKTVSPILRSEVHCFGDKDCYSLAFGTPCLVVFISIVIFVSAKNRYVMKKPEGNVIIDFVKCISLGIKNKICKGNQVNCHWLDNTEDKYDKRFLRDVKKTLSILMLFTAVPIFFALLDQLGSRWTLQATKMNGRMGFITIKPDQLQVFSPICILILIPLSQKYIYPCLWSRSLLINPLHRLKLGGVLAALAFVVSALVEIYIKTTYPEIPQSGFSQLRIFNGNPCSISIHNDQQNIIYTIPSLSHFTNKQISVNETIDIRLTLGGNCIEPRDEIFSLEDNKAISFFMNGNHIERFKENVDKSKSGLPVVRNKSCKSVVVFLNIPYLMNFFENIMLMLVSTYFVVSSRLVEVIFVSAKNRYVMKKPEGNVIIDFVKCISLGIKNKICKGNQVNCHWLDNTEDKYDKRFLRDVKKTLSILMLFTAVPIFFALLDQLGSRWTLQATKMNGRMGFITIKPDQLQVFSPICILILIPLSQKYIYPCLWSRSLLINPLHRLKLGGVLAALAFVVSALVEIYIKTTYPEIPQSGFSQLRIFNGNPCSISIHNDQQNIIYTIPSLSHFTNKQISVNETIDIRLTLGGNCIEPRDEIFSLEDNKAISFFMNGNHIERFKENVDKSKSGLPVVRFFLTDRVQSQNLSLYNEKRQENEVLLHPGVSTQMEVFMSEYSIRDGDIVVGRDIEMKNGGVYIIVIDKVDASYETKVVIITQPNSITMALLLPQFLIISIAEVLFVVTGNEFAFKEAPESMKAVMTAAWLLTEAAGNLIIIVITRVFVNYKQETQSFIYTGLMCISIIVFHFMSKGYQFGPLDVEFVKKERSNSELKYHQVKQAEECLDH